MGIGEEELFISSFPRSLPTLTIFLIVLPYEMDEGFDYELSRPCPSATNRKVLHIASLWPGESALARSDAITYAGEEQGREH